LKAILDKLKKDKGKSESIKLFCFVALLPGGVTDAELKELYGN